MMFCSNGVFMRPVEERDLEEIRKLRNSESTWTWLTDVVPITPAMQIEWFHRISTDKTQIYFSVFKETCDYYTPLSYPGDFVGIVRMDEIDNKNRSVRVGADVVPMMRGQGYGTRIFEALKKFCFFHWNMHRVWLLVQSENAVAIKLYENVGFIREGVMRDAIWRGGTWHGYVIMSILEDEYNASLPAQKGPDE